MSDVNDFEVMQIYGAKSLNHQFEFIGKEKKVYAKIVRGNNQSNIGFQRFNPVNNTIMDGLLMIDFSGSNVRYRQTYGGMIAVGYLRNYTNDVIHLYSERELKYFLLVHKKLFISGAFVHDDTVTPESYNRYQDISIEWEREQRIKEQEAAEAAEAEAVKVAEAKEILRLSMK